MVKQYQDVKISDLQYLKDIFGYETVCDADKQQVTITYTYEWITEYSLKCELSL